MVAKDFENFVFLKREIADINAQLTKIKRRAAIADTVQDSRRAIPYNQYTLKIEGMPKNKIYQCEQLESKLEMRLARLKSLSIAMENYLSQLPDVKIRLIIEYRYLQGRSWRNTATKVFGYPSEDRARKMLKRYLDKQEKRSEQNAG
ncbi:MAG: hypothetical protein FWG65_11835 [Turicibacter sp.]|nr:hypothetical protein [Turicibacter sp.]